jgi:hypothetical protein
MAAATPKHRLVIGRVVPSQAAHTCVAGYCACVYLLHSDHIASVAVAAAACQEAQTRHMHATSHASLGAVAGDNAAER